MKQFTIIVLSFSVFWSSLFASDKKKTHTLEEKIGQLVIGGFRGTSISDTSSIYKDIASGKIGGVILFDYDFTTKTYGRNITSKAQLAQLVSQLKSIPAPFPIFISIDQEGGKVSRLKSKYGFPEFISADSIGRSPNSVGLSQAELLCNTLNELGINVDFAPVVDLNINPQNPVIGGVHRSFSFHADTVISKASLFLKTFKEHGIISCLKHFPGHGSSTKDSHKDFVDVTNTWREIELEPYKYFIKNNMIDMIMVTHVFNKKFDNTYPASLSKKTITDLLKKKLAYNRLVCADDLQMKAISKYYTIEQTIALALNAGNDLLIYGNNLDYKPNLNSEVYNAILSGIKKGNISQRLIDNAFEKIIQLKESLK